MDITVENIKNKLVKDYGWRNLDIGNRELFSNELIKDTLKIINEELKLNKNILEI